MKIQECKRRRIHSIMFIDLYNNHWHTVQNRRKDTEDNLLSFLVKQNEFSEILFPYNFSWVLLPCTHSIAYSMFSTKIDELCMPAYVNMRNLH
jgi:hypothetical protein